MPPPREPPSPDFTLRGSEAPITALHFWHGHLLSGTQQGTVIAWSMRTRRPLWMCEAHAGHSVLMLYMMDSGQTLVSQGRDGWLRKWTVVDIKSKPEQTDSLKCSHLGFCAVAIFKNKDTEVVAMPTNNQSEVAITDLVTKKQLHTLSPPSEKHKHGMVMTIKPTHVMDTDLMLVGYEDGSIALWDIATSSLLASHQFYTESIMAMDFCCNTTTGMVASVTTEVHTFSVTKEERGNTLSIVTGKSVEITNPGVSCVSMRSDGKLGATGGWDGQIRLYSHKHRPLAVLSAHTQSIQALAFSEDLTLAAGSKDKTITLWSLYK